MIPKAVCRRVTFTLALFLTSTVMLNSQETANTFLLTVFLRHDQTKNVNEINEIVGKAGFRDKFTFHPIQSAPETSYPGLWFGIARVSVESSGSQVIHFTTPFFS